MAFKFHCEVDATRILIGTWKWNLSRLLLKRWTPFSDLTNERYDSMPIWVKLPNLPFELWSLDFFKLIGSTLGTFLEADLSFLESKVCYLGRVLVLLDLHNGLASDIDIKLGDTIFSQIMDYVGIPFKCYRCHRYGHLASYYHLYLKRNYREGLKPVWREKIKHVLSVDHEKLRSNSVSPRVEGLDTCSTGIIDPSQSYLQSLKPLCLLDQDANISVSNLEEGLLFFPKLRNLGLISRPKKPFTGSGYFLRSSSKFPRNYPLSSNVGLGQGASGLCSHGLY